MSLLNDLIISQTIFMIVYTLLVFIFILIPLPKIKYSSFLSKLLGGILFSIIVANRINVKEYDDILIFIKIIIGFVIICIFQFGALRGTDLDLETDSNSSKLLNWLSYNCVYLFIIIPLITFIISFLLFDLNDTLLNRVFSGMIDYLLDGRLKIITYIFSYSIFIYNIILDLMVLKLYFKKNEK